MTKTSELCEAQETRNSKSLIWQKRYSVPFRSERFSKTVNGVTTYYNTKDGDNSLTYYAKFNDKSQTVSDSVKLNGTPLGFVWNGAQYLYLTKLFL